MDATGSRDLKLWFADGTNYPGQDDIAARQDRLAEALAAVYARLGDGQRMLLEYKLFEPSFYTTDVPDWGTALLHCQALGDKAQVVVDTGHHAPGVNIEFIVALLLKAGKLGGFDFNSRFYADDDLMVGAADPFQLFRIMHEVVKAAALYAGQPKEITATGAGAQAGAAAARANGPGIAFMLDQCHNIEPKIPAQIRSVMNVQEAVAKALLVDARGAARGPARGRRPGGERGPHGRLQHRRPAAARRAARGDGPRARPGQGVPGLRVRREDRVRASRRNGRRLGSLSQLTENADRTEAAGMTGPTYQEPADKAVAALLARSNRLGSDPKNTNYAGGNASAKGTATDPVTGRPAELLWVKGSGGDLGTLTAAGLAVLRLDALRALVDVYPGVEREDEMVAAFDFCAFGKGGAAPSIDTAMHGLVEAAHVDHLHPDAGIAFATAADGEALTRECFGDRVAWVPWRRPGFQLGLDIAAIRREHPEAIGVILGGHGITAWGDTSDECEARSLEIIATAQKFIDERGQAAPVRQDADRAAAGGASAARGPPPLPRIIRGLASTDKPQLGHYSDHPAVLEFAGSEKLAQLAALGTSCPDHFLRTKVRPMVLDLPPDAPLDDVVARLRELHAAYRADYQAYYERYATPDSPPMRGADPAIVLVPGVGMFSFGADKQTARVAGEFYLNAINVMRGAEAISAYAPIPESEKFRIEYWELEEAKLRRRPKPEAPGGPDRPGHRRRLRHRPGNRAAASGGGRVRGGRRPGRRVGGGGRGRPRLR